MGRDIQGRERELDQTRVESKGGTGGIDGWASFRHSPYPASFYIILCRRFFPFYCLTPFTPTDELRDSQLVVMASEAKPRSVPYRSS